MQSVNKIDRHQAYIETYPITETRKTHILIVEDNPIIQMILERKIQSTGSTCTIAATGEDAFEFIKAQTFDFILTDIGLPEMSGLELAQAIREWEKATNRPRTPIIGLTAHTRDKMLTKCLNSGMNDVLTKPLNVEDVYALLDFYAAQERLYK